MKHKVKLSTISIVLSIAFPVMLIGLLCYLMNEGETIAAYIVAACLVALCLPALFFTPLYVAVDRSNLRIGFSMRVKEIPLSEISEIKQCQPTMGARRICGSGGFMGYWGWFTERDLGRYFAYYGKASDCFLVRLKDGRQYIIGCENPDSVIARVKESI